MIWPFKRKVSLFDVFYRRGLMIHNRDRVKARAFAEAHCKLAQGKA